MRIRSFEDYQQAYQQSIEMPEAFWEAVASHYTWQKPWDSVLNWNFEEPRVEWFSGAKLNITENCLDRHLATQPDATAIIWEPNAPNQSAVHISYRELHQSVCRMANVLKANGVRKGDRVAIYMPMIPELAVSLLACARIGAVHSVVFAGFSAQSLADRINDAQAIVVLTANGIQRGNKIIPAKDIVNEALLNCPSVRWVLVANCCSLAPVMVEGRDAWLEDELQQVDAECPAEPMDSEDLLFILYTSGSTGKPKGVVHTCGGYMVQVGYTFLNAFQYEQGDVYWCTADIGWVTGHSYIVYGPLLNGATTLLFEGIPTYPTPSRFWEVIDKHKVNQFYTAPTAIRSLMACGEQPLASASLASLKTLGSVGEPINEEAWHWFEQQVGKGRCPVIDTWWQTETGGMMIAALAGVSPLRPAHAGQPLPGVQPVLLDAAGNEITENNVEGYLCIKFPWPGMLRTTYGDHERCRLTYFAAYKGYYFTGDGAKRDENGLYRIIGRVDDVINVSGHRFGTAEIENAINENTFAIESAVVGYPHPIKGQGIYAFVICTEFPEDQEAARSSILQTITAQIGPIAKPDKIQFVRGLPKTRSGKIMRRILRKIAEGEVGNLGDVSTLLDPAVVQEIQSGAL